MKRFIHQKIMTTDTSTYRQLFHSLIQHKESEVVEFKKAENNFDFDDLDDGADKNYVLFDDLFYKLK